MAQSTGQGSGNGGEQQLSPALRWLLFLPQLIQQKDFTILIIGETGTGKSTLVNLILGKSVARVEHGAESDSSGIQHHSCTVHGHRVLVIDSPGMYDSGGCPESEERNLRDLADLYRGGGVSLAILCFSLTENRMNCNHKTMFESYHERLGLDWSKVIVAMTHSDCFRPELYKDKLTIWEGAIRNFVQKKFDVPADSIIIRPTAGRYADQLHGTECWFTDLWLSVVGVLDARDAVQYLEMHRHNVVFSSAAPTGSEMFSYRSLPHGGTGQTGGTGELTPGSSSINSDISEEDRRRIAVREEGETELESSVMSTGGGGEQQPKIRLTWGVFLQILNKIWAALVVGKEVALEPLDQTLEWLKTV